MNKGGLRGCEPGTHGRPKMSSVILALLIMSCLAPEGTASSAAPGQSMQQTQTPQTMRLSLDDAIALFLKQNYRLLVEKYGIESAKAREITAGLFPNPELSVGLFSSVTQGCNTALCGGVMPQLSQLFLVAGKRGFRIESAALGTAATETAFEDTIRQLRFTVKDAYYRVQAGKEHLAIDEQIRSRLQGILAGITPEIKPVVSERKRIRVELLKLKADREVIKDVRAIEVANADLRILLGLPPETKLELVTPLRYVPVAPDLKKLRQELAQKRPDLRTKQILQAKRKRELKLAQAMQYPDVTVGAGVMLQGPRGPDNQQQWALGLSVPLPVFDRNQGELRRSAAAVQTADADLQGALNEAINDLMSAAERFMQSQRLIELYHAGILDRALSLLELARQAYQEGELDILGLVDAVRTANETKEDYVETLYRYHRDALELERAAGQPL